MARTPVYARLSVLLAPQARKGVILRRGPSRQVQMLAWDLDKDRIRPGQWLRGKVEWAYLSVSGKLLYYKVADYGRKPIEQWIATSKVPYFTALNFFPVHGMPGSDAMAYARIPDSDLLREFPPYESENRRKDDVLGRDARLRREGWVIIEPGVSKWEWGAAMATQFTTPRVYEKEASGGWRLQMRLLGYNQKNGPWYRFDHAVIDKHGQERMLLPQSDWADWDGKDLLFAQNGCLFRLAARHVPRYAEDESLAKLIVDLNPNRFETITAPGEAARWP